MINYIKIESHELLIQYQSVWSDILEKKNNTNPFIEFGWVYEWWKHFGEQSVEIFVVYEQEVVIGFVPFAVSRKKFTKIYRFIGNGYANYMEVIAEEANLERIIRFVLGEICRCENNVVFDLHGLLGNNLSFETIKCFAQENCFPISTYQTITPYIKLSDLDIKAYIKKRSKLHGLNRREKKLRDLGEISFANVSQDSMDEVFSLHEKRWKKKFDTSRFTEKKEREFFRSLSRLQKGKMKTVIDALYFGSKMIAFHYGFYCRGRYVLYTISHDHDFHLFSPGRFLEKELIIKNFQNGIKIYDMSIGYEAYKMDWATDIEYTNKILFSSKHPIARSIRAKMNLKEKIKEKLKSNYDIVLFKRNVLGRVRYGIRQLLEQNINVREYLSVGYSRIRKKIYNKRIYTFYSIDTHENPGVKEQVLFNKLTLTDALNCEELKSIHYKEISRMFYHGYEGYYPLGRLNFERIIWINSRSIRIDEIAYQEKLLGNTIHLLFKQGDYIEDFIRFLFKTRKVESIKLTIKNDSLEVVNKITEFPISFNKRINGKKSTKK